ncbi:iron-containing alcohol dehydrogenase [Orbaceae bacterium ac157xtp]
MHINSTIFSGKGIINHIDSILKNKQHVLFLTDANIIKLPEVKNLIKKVQDSVPIVTLVDNIAPEPSNHDVANLLQNMKVSNADLVIGVGGGSVLDVAKLVSVLCVKDANITLDQLLDGIKPTKRCTSLLIPTTAGTGSEATPNAILAIPEKETKQGIISPVMLPDYVCFEPSLIATMPAKVAASTGVDALCHLIECFTATISNPVGNNYALQGMQKLFNSLEKSIQDEADLEAKLNMLWASYYGGAAIAHAGTHLVHAMSYPLGGKYHIPHGVANAILLVPCMAFIRESVIDKFAEAYDLLPDADLTLTSEQKSHALVDYFDNLVKRLGLPTKLHELNILPDHLPHLVDGAMAVTRLMNNVPMKVNKDDVLKIYQSLF